MIAIGLVISYCVTVAILVIWPGNDTNPMRRVTGANRCWRCRNNVNKFMNGGK